MPAAHNASRRLSLRITGIEANRARQSTRSVLSAAARFRRAEPFGRSSTELRFVSALDERTGHSRFASVTQLQSRQSTAWTSGITDVCISVFEVCSLQFVDFEQGPGRCLTEKAAEFALECGSQPEGPILRVTDFLPRAGEKYRAVTRRVVLQNANDMDESVEIAKLQIPSESSDAAMELRCDLWIVGSGFWGGMLPGEQTGLPVTILRHYG